MKKIIIILPLFNDWKSINRLLKNINTSFQKRRFFIHIIIINDNSIEKLSLRKKKLNNIQKIEVFNLRRNIGSQNAIYVGLKKVHKKESKGTIVVMDSDGEDDYSKLKILVRKAQLNPNSVVFAKRTKRQEVLILRILNQIRILFTYFLTGKYINIGNFSAFESKNLKKILINQNLSVAYCSGILKNLKNIVYYGVEKKKRYFGTSKVNTLFIIKHSINIIAVFYREVFIRSSVLTLICLSIFQSLKFNYAIFYLYLLINLIFLLSYLHNTKKNFNIGTIRNIQKIK